MPEKPKKEKESARDKQDSSWETDQKEKSYYYDDACGYEVYEPDQQDDDEDES